MKKNSWLNELDADEREILAYAALVPLTVSIDILILSTGLSAIKILTLLEKLTEIGIFHRDPVHPMGMYHLANPESADNIINSLGHPDLQQAAGRMIQLIEKHIEEGIDKDQSLTRLYAFSQIPDFDLERVLRAARHLKESKKLKDAALGYKLILDKSTALSATREGKKSYIVATLGFVEIQGPHAPLPLQVAYLKQARKFAGQLGTPRMLARTNLIYARALTRNSGEMTDTARELVSESCRYAHESGDPNIIRKSEIAKCGMLHWEGKVSEAIERWDRTVGHLEDLSFFDEDDLHHLAALGWAYGICGKTARGVGLCEAALQKAAKMNNQELVCYINMMAGMILFEARRIPEGESYFKRILEYPEDAPGDFALRQAHLAMALIDHMAGRKEKALEHLKTGFYYSERFGWPHHRAPWILDCIADLESKGYCLEPGFFEKELQRIMAWPDLYMQGVVFQYHAQLKKKMAKPKEVVLEDLMRSRQFLMDAGAQVELGRTLTLIAEYYLEDNDKEQAIRFAKASRDILDTINEDLFPKELENLIAKENPEENLLGTIIKVGNTLGTIRNRKKLLENIINVIMHLTLAERGAVFLLRKGERPEIAASRNLEPSVCKDAGFEKNYDMIQRVALSGKGTIIRATDFIGAHPLSALGLSWIICCPISLQSRTQGLFYLDSVHEPMGIPEKGLALLEAIGAQVAIALDNVEAYEEIAILRDRLENESRFFQMEVELSRHLDQIVGKSKAIRIIQAQIQKVAPTDSAVLIEGETGVGKELVARGIHRISQRAEGPFIPLNTAALSEGLVASELFGHERGAFTGAVNFHPGRFELANGGTIFLDDIQNIPMEIQAKLLRAIQEKKFERVGGTKSIHSDFRIIAASNHPLSNLVEKGAFRADLYYRLNVFPINIPPLRERPEDIPHLSLHFLEIFKRKMGKEIRGISHKDMQRLVDYHWPGNVRELEHIIERAVILTEGQMLGLPEISKHTAHHQSSEENKTLRDYEKAYIMKILNECRWRVSGPNGAAKILDLKPTTLFARMKRLGIKKNAVL